jgi:hypothetical protein
MHCTHTDAVTDTNEMPMVRHQIELPKRHRWMGWQLEPSLPGVGWGLALALGWDGPP